MLKFTRLLLKERGKDLLVPATARMTTREKRGTRDPLVILYKERRRKKKGGKGIP